MNKEKIAEENVIEIIVTNLNNHFMLAMVMVYGLIWLCSNAFNNWQVSEFGRQHAKAPQTAAISPFMISPRPPHPWMNVNKTDNNTLFVGANFSLANSS